MLPVNLYEQEVELSILGSFFDQPRCLPFLADNVTPEWFSNDFVRTLLEIILEANSDGEVISQSFVVSQLPEQCGDMTRGEFYSHAVANAVTPDQLPGLVKTIKDRWARRIQILIADKMKASAADIASDPFSEAKTAVADLDNINAIEGRDDSGSAGDCAQEALFNIDNKVPVYTTGISSLDDLLGGYRPGNFYVIAGRPGMGKSALMCASLRRTAYSGHGVVFFSLEMPKNEIGARMMSDSLAPYGPSYGDIMSGKINDTDYEAIKNGVPEFYKFPLHVDASPSLSIVEISARARKLKAEYEAQGTTLRVICVDHIGLVKPSGRYMGNKVGETGEISNSLRALAKELDCCVIGLSQLNRAVESRDDKRPMMSDLRWAGEIEQDAHVVAFIYRPYYYLSQDPNADPMELGAARDTLELLVRKNRNGATSDVKLHCQISHSSVRDIMQ